METHLKGEGDLVAQGKGKRHSEDGKDPPARFIPHYVSEHKVLLFSGLRLMVFSGAFTDRKQRPYECCFLFTENVAQGINHRDPGQVNEPPGGF